MVCGEYQIQRISDMADAFPARYWQYSVLSLAEKVEGRGTDLGLLASSLLLTWKQQLVQ